ncbi:hypothetical protein [Phreatobacter sp.]|uniref:hypothetical protein n=1 Tax=Phreatobacter sp. TaxID=1966341 RepID=UPI003F70E71D
MRATVIALIGVIASTQVAGAQYLADAGARLPNPAEQHIWMEVTRPMLGCSAAQDDPELIPRLHNAFADWMGGQQLPPGCSAIRVGTKLLLDYVQPTGALRLIEVCSGGCSPFMWPVYMPQHGFVGAFLRPTQPPAYARRLGL